MRIKFKQLFSAFIAGVMLLSQASVFAEVKKVSVLHEYFDDYATNSVPKKMVLSGTSNSRVVEDGEQNKAFYMQTGYVKNSLTIPVIEQTDSLFVASVDLKYSEAVGGVDVAFVSNTFMFRPVVIKADGIITTADGKYVGALSDQKYNAISVLVDTKSKTYTVYFNYKAVAGNWRYTENLAGITSVQITADVAEAESDEKTANCGLFIDNVRVYNRAKPSKCYTKKPYLDEEISFTPDESMAQEASNVYVNNDFDNERTQKNNVSIANQTAGNIGEFVTDKITGNTYLRFERAADGSVFVDFNVNSTSNRVAIEADMRIDNPGLTAYAFYIRDNTKDSRPNMSLGSISGGSLNISGKIVATFTPKKWVKVGYLVNLARGTYDVWIDGEPVVENQAMMASLTQISHIRLYCYSGMGDVMLDNVKVYDGKEFRDLSGSVVSSESIFASNSYAVSRLSNNLSISPATNHYYVGGTRKDISPECLIEGEDYLVPLDVIKDMFDVEAVQDSQTVTIANSIRFNFGENKMYVNSEEVTISSSAQLIDEVVYIPLYAYIENATNKYASESDVSNIIISDNPISYNESDRKEVDYYMTYNRPTAEKIKESFLKRNTASGKDAHPRLYGRDEDFDRVNKLVTTDENAKALYDGIMEDADAVVETEADSAIYIFTQYNIQEEKRIIDALVEDMYALGMAYRLTGKEKYAKRAKEEIDALISQNEILVMQHQLSLGELSYVLAIYYDWFYEYFTSEYRRELLEWAVSNVFDERRTHYYSTTEWWPKSDLNWNAVLNGSIIALSLAIADEEEYSEIAFDAIEKALRSLEYHLSTFGPDGGYFEGKQYWSYAMQYLQVGLGAMYTALDSMFGIEKSPGLSRAAWYGINIDSISGGAICLGDAGTGGHSAVPNFFWSVLYNDRALLPVHKQWSEKCNISFGGIESLIWYRPELMDPSGMSEFKKDVQFTSRLDATCITREGIDNENQMFAAWAGGNLLVNGGHNHADVGTFFYDVNGYRFATDPGQKNYDVKPPQDYFRVRAEAHNVIVINPNEKSSGQDDDGYGEVLYFKTGEGGVVSAIDMQSCYKETTSKYIRGYMTGDNRRSLTVRDEITLIEPDSDVRWNMITQGDVTIKDSNTAIISRNGTLVKLEFETNASEFELMRTDAVNYPESPQTESVTNDSNFSRVLIKMKASGDLWITVKLSPMGEPAENTGIPQGNIASWQPPAWKETSSVVDTSAYQLSSLTLDGKMVTGFKANTEVYEETVEKGEIPVVEAAAVNGLSVNVEQAQTSDGMAIVSIYSEASPEYKNYYLVDLRELVDYEPVGGKTRYRVVEASASSIFSSDFPVKCSIDQHNGTMWSSDGDGEWLSYDLGSVKSISQVAIAMRYGDRRIYKFDLQVSDDGVNYTTVYSGANSKKTESYEFFDINTKARYVKFVGHGNNENMRNNVTEMAILQ